MNGTVTVDVGDCGVAKFVCTNAIAAGVVTVNAWPLLATPPTVTATLPVVAPVGTETTTLVADQLDGVAVVPLNLTVLVPCVDPKFDPAIVTTVPTGPLIGVRLLMVGAVLVTVNAFALLATPPTVTTTFPVVAPVGTGTTTLVADQLDGVAVVPLKVTVLEPFVDPKFAPAIVTAVPTAPLPGVRLVMLGAALAVTVNVWALLAAPPTVTTTFPVVAPEGTGTTIVLADQLEGAAAVPLNATVLVPSVDPKFEPAIVTEVPTAPVAGVRLAMLGTTTGGGLAEPAARNAASCMTQLPVDTGAVA